jgi:tol-pal system protein YbgF
MAGAAPTATPARGARPIVGPLAAGLLVGLLLGAGPARADLAAVGRQVERLQQELAELRQIQPVQAGDPALARFEVRLSQLEEELRRLTGRIEQLEFGQRALERRFDQLVQDLDQRLRPLEEGAGITAAPPLQEPRPAIAAPAAPPGTGEGEQALGQVPESAVLALPRPDPSTIPPPPEMRTLPPQQQYDAAMELLRAGNYAGAEGGLQLFLELNPDHPLAGNAAYWLAETYYVRRNYAAAAAAFARNYRTYGKDAQKAPDNLLKLGMSLQGLGEISNACLSYDELAREFPNAPAHIQQALGRERTRAQCT